MSQSTRIGRWRALMSSLAIWLSLAISVPHSRAFADPAEGSPEQETRTRFEEPTPRDHSAGETLFYLGVIYVSIGTAYYLVNKKEVDRAGSMSQVVENLAHITFFDEDLPTANWVTHVYTGNLCYQFYRSRAYTKTDAFLLTALQSALFEFTVEIVEEPASLEDLVNTPVFGSILGRGLELASFPLLNSDSWFARTLGHVINPPTIFGFYEGRRVVTEARVVPLVNRSSAGLALQVRF